MKRTASVFLNEKARDMSEEDKQRVFGKEKWKIFTILGHNVHPCVELTPSQEELVELSIKEISEDHFTYATILSLAAQINALGTIPPQPRF